MGSHFVRSSRLSLSLVMRTSWLALAAACSQTTPAARAPAPLDTSATAVAKADIPPPPVSAAEHAHVAPPADAPPAIDPDAIPVKVTNPLDEPRTSEVIVLPVAELRKAKSGVDVTKLVVLDEERHIVVSQWVDDDGDDAPDTLVFQSDFAGKQTKHFSLQPGERKPLRPDQYKVYGRFVRERHDDFAWENDRVAHRMYGTGLETWKKDPLTSSGIDVWTKRTKRLLVNEWYQTDNYHSDSGDGADMYAVGPSRGCGGTGIWSGGKLHVSRNFVSTRVLAAGPIRLIFELTYAPWRADGTQVSEVKRVTVDAGKNFDHFESRYKIESGPHPGSVGIGIAKHPGSTITLDREVGLFHALEPLKDNHQTENGNLICAVIAPPSEIVESKDLEKDYLLVAKMPASADVQYYAGFGWDRSGDFASQAAFVKYAETFARTSRAPVTVSFEK